MTERDVTNFLHTRNCSLLLVLFALCSTLLAVAHGDTVEVIGNRGIVLPSPNLWIANRSVSLILNLAFICLIAFGAIWINKAFNIMRSMTSLWSGVFAVIICSLPALASQFNGGTLLCAIVMAVTMVMFSCFADRSRTRRVFLMFFILAVTSLFQYAAIFFALPLLLGLGQMRIFNLRSLIAALLGLLTPPWIIFGCGLISPAEVRWPRFIDTLSVLDTPEMVLTFVAVGLTMLIGVFAMAGNLIKILSYTAKFRSANGFMALMLLFTIFFIFVDYNNLSVYIPLLDMLVAYQIAHFFATHRARRSYIAILSVVAIYALIYLSAIIL